jgi:hypothetical protein
MKARLYLWVLTVSLLPASCIQRPGPVNHEDDRTTLIQYTGKRTQDEEKAISSISICTFNIQFLGSSRKRDDRALTEILRSYDIVVIQEMVSPPLNGSFPDGSKYTADPESRHFVDLMLENGFRYILSEEDTGPGKRIHSNGTGTEWFISFYKPSSVIFAPDLPHGFLETDRSNNGDFDRVPYAFPFRMVNGKNDFVFISVHLHPGSGLKNMETRRHELASIDQWIRKNNQSEKDFIILGDMNIQNSDELIKIIPAGMTSLNDECRRTNTLINSNPPGFGARPYDHIFYRKEYSENEVDTDFDCRVIDLITTMKPFWKGPGRYPGIPYNHTIFRQYYSDHDPLIFRLKNLSRDDD